jgi:hypothetical protein
MYLNRRSVTIEGGDCDPAGIVFYRRCFAMFDARIAMRRRFAFVGIPMVETSANNGYRRGELAPKKRMVRTVRIATELGFGNASPAEAREITGEPAPVRVV